MALIRKRVPYFIIAVCIVFSLYLTRYNDLRFSLKPGEKLVEKPLRPDPPPSVDDGRFHWKNRPQQYPVTSMIPLPSGAPKSIPKIQHQFKKETSEAKALREQRLEAVKESFTHGWKGYKERAWMKDELTPISGQSRNSFGGWAATLVDAMDTLWIMNLHTEFEEAVMALKGIDFSSTDEKELNVFETTIRYLGGFLAAYDLSDGRFPILLEKAIEVGDMLYAAFDTPSRMPVTRWDWKLAATGKAQDAGTGSLVAEIGSLSLEFTRLSQLSGDPKYFDAIQRITDIFDRQQHDTQLPGMWPLVVNPTAQDFTKGDFFTFGAMADSVYEYFPKEYILLGGRSEQYRKLYEKSIEPGKKHIFYRPMTPQNSDIRISGNVHANGPQKVDLDAQGQHLACFTGGMVGLGAKIFDQPNDLSIARKLVDGCIWAYESMPSGIMPETFHLVPCDDRSNCAWDENKWRKAVDSQNDGESEEYASLSDEDRIDKKIKDLRLVPGYASIDNRKYILRPEALESIFILYRITGDTTLQDKAWSMFQSIKNHTRTEFGNCAIGDVTVADPPKWDSMESFWMAETLKYLYLIFSDPEILSLDDFVLNTEAHPFRRPK